MANPFTQYLKDTRNELNHVAWPTQRQTIVFTALVVVISLGIAAYVGLLDYGLRITLLDIVTSSGNPNASNAVQVTQQPTVSTSTATGANPTFNLNGGSTNSTK
ncbi:MAG: preprotein translocase subunit SecE [Candidatus Pacebacteria bacterium]|nr:preprotein translocase subunit SecE [Candidatus Paceibacterota bacterium]